MKKSDLKYMPEFFDRYINLIPENETLLEGLERTKSIFLDIKTDLEAHQDFRYAEGKWTPKDMLQHIIDTERIQAYRALVFSRNDSRTLPGYEENLYAKNTNASDRTIADLLEEYKIVRESSVFLFKNFSEEMLQREGNCFKVQMTSLALGFVIIGHPMHHLNILKERYLKK